MARGLNKVILIGNLGRDPELRRTSSGAAVCTLNLATNASYTDRDGNRVDTTEWHRVVVWGRMAETCDAYLQAGRRVYVEGSLQTRTWEDREGRSRTTTEVKARRVDFLDARSSSDTPEHPPSVPTSANA